MVVVVVAILGVVGAAVDGAGSVSAVSVLPEHAATTNTPAAIM